MIDTAHDLAVLVLGEIMGASLYSIAGSVRKWWTA